jgi:hypothetical protein
MGGPNVILDNLCTYKLSQDHLEMYFGTLRRRGGQNDNLTTRQLMGNYKRLLCHPDILNSLKGNCIQQDGTRGLSIDNNANAPNFIPNIMKANFAVDFSSEYGLLVENMSSSSSFKLNANMNIANCLVSDLQKVLDCFCCKALLLSKECPEGGELLKIQGTDNYASFDVSSLCNLGNQIFSFFEEEQGMFGRNVGVIDHLLEAAASQNHDVQFSDHPKEIEGVWQEEFVDHPQRLAQLVLKKYFSIRLHHYGKLKRNHIKKTSMRSKRLKLTHNLGH